MIKPIQILAVGYPSFDRILRTNRAPAVGETGIILDPPGIPEATAGGCVNNIVVAAARLGVGAAPLIVLGDDADGDKMASMLAAENIDTGAVHRVPGGKTSGTFLFVEPEGGHQTFYYPGSADENIPLELPAQFLESLRYGVITVGNAYHTRYFVDQLSAAGVPLVWSLRNDPHAFPQELVERLASACEMLIMNEFEARQLTRLLGVAELDDLLAGGVKTIVMTLGGQGSRIYQSGRQIEIPIAKAATVVDPTGAGDAFVGGLLSGLCLGAPIETAARIGAVASAYVVEQWGCQTGLPDWERMAERYTAAFGEFKL